eukprot:gene6241-6717_t
MASLEDIQPSSSYNSTSDQETSSTSSSTDERPEGRQSRAEPAGVTNSSALHAWVDIFAISKLVLCMAPRNLSNPYIMIQQAQKEFLLNFGFGEDQLPLPLSKLFGNTSERAKIARLQQCMLTGRSFSEFMNLHKSNGGSLSCYVSLLCLTNQRSSQRQHQVLRGSFGGGEIGGCGSEILKYGILTVRSASVVGNSKYSGIGLMGTDRVPRERVQDMPSTGNTSRANTTSKDSQKMR